MDLENIDPVTMCLKIYPNGDGFSFSIDINMFRQKELIKSDEIFTTSEAAFELGSRIVMRFKKEFNLVEHAVH